jgi:hypothetical protein
MKWVIAEDEYSISLYPESISPPSELIKENEVLTTFDVECDKKREEALSKFYDIPSHLRASGYKAEYFGLDYNVHRWDDMSTREYKMAQREVEAGRRRCKEDGLSEEG